MKLIATGVAISLAIMTACLPLTASAAGDWRSLAKKVGNRIVEQVADEQLRTTVKSVLGDVPLGVGEATSKVMTGHSEPRLDFGREFWSDQDFTPNKRGDYALLRIGAAQRSDFGYPISGARTCDPKMLGSLLTGIPLSDEDTRLCRGDEKDILHGRVWVDLQERQEKSGLPSRPFSLINNPGTIPNTITEGQITSSLDFHRDLLRSKKLYFRPGRMPTYKCVDGGFTMLMSDSYINLPSTRDESHRLQFTGPTYTRTPFAQGSDGEMVTSQFLVFIPAPQETAKMICGRNLTGGFDDMGKSRDASGDMISFRIGPVRVIDHNVLTKMKRWDITLIVDEIKFSLRKQHASEGPDFVWRP